MCVTMLRLHHRLREIAIQSITQATAEERRRRTQLSKTRIGTRTFDLEVDGTVEFWRAPEHKEVSGWKGPATVVHIDHEAGVIHVKWQGKVLLCRPGDVRKSLLSWLVSSSMIYAEFDPRSAQDFSARRQVSRFSLFEQDRTNGPQYRNEKSLPSRHLQICTQSRCLCV